jgi:hypothetical protein
MKAVLISTRPEWCAKIASGEKTIEVRKTRPKLETPFKCYIYCTKDAKKQLWTGPKYSYADDHSHNAFDKCGNGKVIGEFLCDRFIVDRTFGHDEKFYSAACMSACDAAAYAMQSPMYGWHILDLKIYDNPLELSKFRVEDKAAIKACKHRFRAGQPEYVARHGGWLQGGWGCMKTGEPEWCENCLTKPLTSPPQSWCYVEEHRKENK